MGSNNDEATAPAALLAPDGSSCAGSQQVRKFLAINMGQVPGVLVWGGSAANGNELTLCPKRSAPLAPLTGCQDGLSTAMVDMSLTLQVRSWRAIFVMKEWGQSEWHCHSDLM